MTTNYETPSARCLFGYKFILLPSVMLIMAVAALFASAQIQTFDRNLSYGMKNDQEVLRLQQFLTAQGLYNGPVTGNYLSLTESAVKAFQERENIAPQSGYFGPLTKARANQIIQAEQPAAALPETQKQQFEQEKKAEDIQLLKDKIQATQYYLDSLKNPVQGGIGGDVASGGDSPLLQISLNKPSVEKPSAEKLTKILPSGLIAADDTSKPLVRVLDDNSDGDADKSPVEKLISPTDAPRSSGELLQQKVSEDIKSKIEDKIEEIKEKYLGRKTIGGLVTGVFWCNCSYNFMITVAGPWGGYAILDPRKIKKMRPSLFMLGEIKGQKKCRVAGPHGCYSLYIAPELILGSQ